MDGLCDPRDSAMSGTVAWFIGTRASGARTLTPASASASCVLAPSGSVTWTNHCGSSRTTSGNVLSAVLGHRKMTPDSSQAVDRSSCCPAFSYATPAAHYTITDQRSYGCSSFHDGKACSNSVRVRRDRIEAILLDPIRKELLTPERAERMAKEMQAYYLDRARAMQTQAVQQPHALQEFTARIERLRERLKRGDPDMTADEIQAAIDLATAKRNELQHQHQGAMPSARMFAMLPRAAEAYRRQITLGLEGPPRASLKARLILARTVRRENQAGSVARWWADSPLEPSSRRLAKGPRDIW